MSNPKNLRVAVLSGGNSSEREVSLSSGREVAHALESRGYLVQVLDPQNAQETITELASGNYDVAFIALHGKGGEDGTIQGVCESLNLPYTGSGVLASALAMDKAQTKHIYTSQGIPTAASMSLNTNDTYNYQEIIDVVGTKCVVKPNSDGSSVGMSIVHKEDELPAAIKKGFTYAQELLIEEYIEGTEVTVAVLGNNVLRVLPVIQIVPHAEFYDYDVKYSASGADHIIPAPIPSAIYSCVQELAKQAHHALGCTGVSRTDFIITPNGDCIALETNTIPGMTPTSLLPDAARHDGLEFVDVCELLIELALEAHSAH